MIAEGSLSRRCSYPGSSAGGRVERLMLVLGEPICCEAESVAPRGVLTDKDSATRPVQVCPVSKRGTSIFQDVAPRVRGRLRGRRRDVARHIRVCRPGS